MKEIIKIERFLKAYENTWENQRWQIECEGYSRLNEYTLNVSSDFGDYPDLIVFEAELLTIDKSLINEKIKSMNSICDKMIDDFDFIMSNRKFSLHQKIGITNFQRNYLTPIANESNTKVLKFDDNDLINTIFQIKSIIQSDKTEPAKLIKSLSETQQSYLYKQLTENSLFLPIETDCESFCFVFGNSEQPKDFKPLQWMQNKQLLRELITVLKHPDIKKISKSKYLLPAFFIDEKQKTILYLPNEKIKPDILSTKIQEITKKMRQTK